MSLDRDEAIAIFREELEKPRKNDAGGSSSGGGEADDARLQTKGESKESN